MGNWRTVNLVGTMSAAHAALLLDLLDEGPDYERGWDQPYACLTFSRARPGLCGLGEWPAEHVNRAGNLAERDFTVEDVARALRALVEVAGSMMLKVHCGGDYESDECVATISVGEGLVVTGKAEVATIAGPSDEQVMGNFMRNLLR